MRLPCRGQYSKNQKHLMRKCGYAEFRDPVTKKMSYVRLFQPRNYYPRFHVYLEDAQDGFVVDLHLDQKKPSYGGSSAHAGEYDGPVVEQELKRIFVIIRQHRIG